MLLSVVVPTHRRPGPLARCLAALAQQDPAAGEYEVVVVEDGGPTPALASLRRDLPAVDHALRWVAQPRAGPAVARNRGARAARGELLAFTDDDCRPRPGWLAALRRAHLERPDAILGGPTVNALADNACSEATQVLVDRFTAEQHARGRPFLASSNLALARRHFLAAGGFDETFPLAAGEDRDLCARLADAGHAFHRVPGAVVEHHHHLDLRGFLRQHYRYGRGARRVRRAGGGAAGRPFERLAFYRDLVRGRGARGPGGRLSALLLLSQAAHTVGYLTERVRGGP